MSKAFVEFLEPRVLFAVDATQIADRVLYENAQSITIDLDDQFEFEGKSSGAGVRFQTNVGDIDILLWDRLVPETVNNFLSYVDSGAYENMFFHRSLADFVLQGGGYTYTPEEGTSLVDTNDPIDNEFYKLATVSGENASVVMNSQIVQLPAGTDLSDVSAGDRIRLIGRDDGELNGSSNTDFYEIGSVDDEGDTVTIIQTPTDASESGLSWFIVAPQNTRGTLSMAKVSGDPDSATNNFFVNYVDNSDNLDIQNEGFTVFGEVTQDTIAIVDAIEALGDVYVSATFPNLPLQNYTSGSITEEHLIRVVSAESSAGDESLSYSYSFARGKKLVSASLSDSTGELEITPKAGRSGRVTIKVTATDTFGNSETQIFDVRIVDDAAPLDFDGDGQADLIYRDEVSKENVAWIMQGRSRSQIRQLTSLAQTGWQLVGVADFTGDGESELVFRNRVSGKNTTWSFVGNKLANSLQLPRMNNLNWTIGAIGDFDGDQDPDIWWRNKQSGLNAIWSIENRRFVQSTRINLYKNKSWMPVAAGDLNADGTDDVMFRHRFQGLNRFVMIENNAVAETVVGATKSDKNWTVGGIADFTGDGLLDIVWRHKTNGKNALWEMSGTELLGGKSLPRLSDTSWRLAGNLV